MPPWERRFLIRLTIEKLESGQGGGNQDVTMKFMERFQSAFGGGKPGG